MQDDDLPATNEELEAAPQRDLNPWRTAWLQPRETIQWIVAKNPELHVLLLAGLSGVSRGIERSSYNNSGDDLSLIMIIGLALVFGALFGILGLWIGCYLISFSGKWLGGEGDEENIRAAMAWASVPTMVALALWIPNLWFFGIDMFTEEMPTLDAQPLLVIPYLIISLTQFVLAIWSIVLLCKMIAQVQGFVSAWKGLANLVLAMAVIVVPILMLIMIVSFFSQG
jgi:hypothetical protein